MRIVVIGAYGLVGGYIAARLIRDGHSVVGVGRDIQQAQRRFPTLTWVRADLRSATERDWRIVLAGADAVVNCAGALQDSPRDDLAAVHEAAVSKLVVACLAVGVPRFVQISAAGVDRGVGAFGRSKQEADDALRRSPLAWIVLRPGLVLAPSAYGGSALLRGLAAFPGFLPALTPQSVVQTVSIDDVAEAVARCIDSNGPARVTCDLVAAEATTLGDVLRALRGWLGLAPGPMIEVPEWCARLVARGADSLALLGWRSPMRTGALDQLAAGVRGNANDAEQLLGLRLLGLSSTLARWPSGVQERWFAHLYFVKPFGLATLAGFWAASGLIGFLSHRTAADLLIGAGIAPGVAGALVLCGSLIDLALGVLACFRRAAPFALMGMVAMTAAYLVGGTAFLPTLWLDPLGPLIKSIPAAILAVAVFALMDER
jgi:uncharacterized protein YbjT (DUF2867 family)